MTDHERLAKQAMDEVFGDATTNALLYGVGFIRIGLTKIGRMEFSCVGREEFRDTADQLIWLDNNAAQETKQ